MSEDLETRESLAIGKDARPDPDSPLLREMRATFGHWATEPPPPPPVPFVLRWLRIFY